MGLHDVRSDRQTDRHKNYNTVDVMKFTMACFIVILHVRPFLDISPWLDYGCTAFLTRCAVPYFFVASGFFLYRKMQDGNMNIPIVRRYWMRILRVYLVWTAIYIPWIYMQVMQGHVTVHNLLLVLRNTVMSGSYWQLWFLNALLVAVIIVTFLLYYRRSFRQIFLITGIAYIGVLCACGYHGLYVYFVPPDSLGAHIVSLIEKVFVRPRNGICFGAIYLAIGAYIAICKPKFRLKTLIRATGLSWLVFLFEVIVLTHFNLIADKDAYLSLIPVAYFMFLLSKQINLPDAPAFIYMRKMSMFLFYVHPIGITLMQIIQTHVIKMPVHSMVTYLGTMAFSLVTAVVVIQLSQKERYSFLKILY